LIAIDSSGWLEFFADGPYADEFAGRLRQPANVITPSIAIYEVYKWIKRERSEDDALYAAATMRKTLVVDLSDEIALAAADLSLAHKLPMADAIISWTAARGLHRATHLQAGRAPRWLRQTGPGREGLTSKPLGRHAAAH
jgi:predicted nucleic acid-binding protein